MKLIKFFKKSLCLLLLTTGISACSQQKGIKNPGTKRIDYVTIGKLHSKIDWPYIIHLTQGDKALILIGTSHPVDTSSKEFSILEKQFFVFNPDVALNEGGQVDTSEHYKDRNTAIVKNGEIGLLKFLADNKGIQIFNGDFNEQTEFRELLKLHSIDDLLLYLGVERCVYGFKYNTDTTKTIEAVYEDFTKNYLQKNGFPLREEQTKWNYFTALYQHKIKVPFDLKSFDVELFDFLNPDCTYCEIGRSSKKIRDNVLLYKISKALQLYDKVLVVFGGAHALAIEPALKDMMQH